MVYESITIAAAPTTDGRMMVGSGAPRNAQPALSRQRADVFLNGRYAGDFL